MTERGSSNKDSGDSANSAGFADPLAREREAGCDGVLKGMDSSNKDKGESPKMDGIGTAGIVTGDDNVTATEDDAGFDTDDDVAHAPKADGGFAEDASAVC